VPNKRTPKTPPPLRFPNPPCSLCDGETVEIAGRFRCQHCQCSWDADTAHLYSGDWDTTAIAEVA
jgi:tRNA(Ile2) C34 agmatinyltransferase TiaS